MSVHDGDQIDRAADGLSPAELDIRAIGPCMLPSPVAHRLGSGSVHFVGAADKVLLDDSVSGETLTTSASMQPAGFELAGPRDRIFFDPRVARFGIVTCGGLAPGLNNVIRGIVLELCLGYGVRNVLGFRFGYEGIVLRHGHVPIELTPDVVAHIHHEGGTVLGTSRGGQDVAEVVDSLQANSISALFAIGGDGTLRGALAIAQEIWRRGLAMAVVGIPKTIDNDIAFIDRSFGFVTAYSAAVDVIRSARVEALAALNGIGLVKLMGRQSGFLACQAALASTEADLVLIPELPLKLEGHHGFLACLERVVERKGHAVVVVAEGAGQDLLNEPGKDPQFDKSGNPKLKDIGVYLRDTIVAHFASHGREATVKYIDPSYAIRSVPACPSDSVYCWNMARNAVHAAMAGNTAMLIGRWHGRFVHVPIELAIRRTRRVSPDGDLWVSVVESTGQPLRFDETPEDQPIKISPG
jgi:6-phosphofructokinase 1